MRTINTLIENSSLEGMPLWYKATTLSIFATIVSLLITMTVLLFMFGPEMNIKFGY